MIKIEFVNYGIEVYIGEPRSGKTLCMVKDTYEDYIKNQGYTIFSNFKLNAPFKYQLLTIETLRTFEKHSDTMQNCIVLVDEMHQFFDSRNFMQKHQKHMTHLLGMCGKRNITLRGTTHFMENLDYRIRQYCEKKIFIIKGLVTGNKWKPILNNNRILSDEENDRLYIKAESFTRKLINYDFVTVPLSVDFVKAKSYFNLYDTRELIVAERDEVKDTKDKRPVVEI